jgi:hypothetical protein
MRRATDTLSTPRQRVRRLREGRPEMVKKILTWGLVAFLIFFVAYRPTNAAAVFRQLGTSLYDVATGIGQFFSSLVA